MELKYWRVIDGELHPTRMATVAAMHREHRQLTMLDTGDMLMGPVSPLSFTGAPVFLSVYTDFDKFRGDNGVIYWCSSLSLGIHGLRQVSR